MRPGASILRGWFAVGGFGSGGGSTPTNQAPSASAGVNQTVSGGVIVTLSGSGTDPEGSALTYTWTQISGPAVTLSGSGPSRTFSAPAATASAQSLVFRLVVNDGQLNSPPATTTVTISGTAPGPGPGPSLEATWRTLSVMPVVNPLDYGAAGNGTADDTTELEAAINALPAAGGIVYLPAGRSFRKTNVINVNKNHVKFWAPNRQAEIFGDVGGTGSDRQAIFSLGTAGFGFFGVKFRSNATTRGGTGDDHTITAGPGTTLFEAVGVEVDGSRAAGIFMLGATECYVNGNYVHRTQADHIHHTLGTRSSWCWGNWIYNASPTLGDDGIACVTYGGESLTGDLEWWSNVLLGSGWGRGYTVVGGENVNIHDNVAIGAAGAGILIATEPAFDSEGVRNITIRNNRVTQCGHTISHPGILISGLHTPAGPINNVTLTDNVSAANVNGDYRAEGSITNLVNTGLSTNTGDLAPLPTLADVALKDTSILMTRDVSHVASGSRPGLYRIHVRQSGAGFQERFEYVVKGTPANVTSWVTARVAAGAYLAEQRTVSGTAYALLLSAAPVTLGSGVTGVTHAEIRAGNQIGSTGLSWLWNRIDNGDYLVAGTTSKSLGMNIGGVSYFDDQIVFLDLIKQSPDWGLNNGGINPPLDTNGWPTSLPGGSCGVSFRVPTGGGLYVLLYDGVGTVQFGNGTISNDGSGRKVINLGGGMNSMTITSTGAGANYMRNIRLVPLVNESNHATVLFNSTFLNRISNFGCLRFLDFLAINFSEVNSWANRASPTYFSQMQPAGSAIEYAIAMCNAVDADMWMLIPHRVGWQNSGGTWNPIANPDQYITNAANLIATTLKPGLKCYVEYSNEIWNFSHGDEVQEIGVRYGQLNGLASQFPDEYDTRFRYQAWRSKQIFDIFRSALGNSRVIAVLASQMWDLRVQILCDVPIDGMPAHTYCDAISVAPYIGGFYPFEGPAQGPHVQLFAPHSSAYSAISAATVAGTVEYVRRDIAIQGAILQDIYALAQTRGKPLVCYEAGQHLASDGGHHGDTALQTKMDDAQRHADMGVCYTQYLNMVKQYARQICMFKLCEGYSVWGRFGHLETIDQNPDPPRWAAMLSWMAANPRWW